MNVIKQIVNDGEYGAQTIKMIVRANERGAQGEQGEKGDAATVTVGNTYTVSPDAPATVMNSGTGSDAVLDFYIPKGDKGEPGAIHYTAGTGIKITDGNVIEATGDATAAWGGIQGNINSQTDLQTEFGLYTKTADLPVNIGEVLSTPTDVAFVGTNNIQDEAVTTAKIDDEAVTTAKINDGAVTAAKLADNAANSKIRTESNLEPTNDTVSGWLTLLDTPGLYVTGYSDTHFAHQPSIYGTLYTYQGVNSIAQIFQSLAGATFFRTGDIASGWFGSNASGAFRTAVADEYLGNSVDLNTLTKTGTYRIYTPFTNAPANPAYATVFVTSYSDDYRCVQYFNAIDDDGKGGVYVRFSYNNSNSRAWTAWKTLTTWT